MFVFFLYALLLQSTLFTPSPSVQDNSHVQIDRHIQNLVELREPHVQYWFLVQLAFTRSDYHAGIQSRLTELTSGASVNPVADCYFDAFLTAGPNASLSQFLVNGIGCEESADLAIAALYEAPSAQRTAIAAPFSQIRARMDAAATALSQKALALPFRHEHLFAQREFQLRDFYLLQELTVTDDGYKALALAWEQSVLDEPRITNPLEFLKLQVLIGIHHTIEFDYAKNYTYLRFVQGNAFYTNLISKQTTLKRLAFASYIQGYYQTTLSFYRDDLLPLTRSIRDQEEVLRVELDYGNILFRLGDTRGALNIYQRVYEHFDQITDERYRSALLNNLAVSYLNTGFFEQYVSLQLQAYDQASSVASYPAQLRILNNLYIYHLRNADWTNAQLYLNNALQIAQRESLTGELAEIYTLFATYYRDRESNYEEALRYLELALSMINRETSYRIYSTTVFELATTLILTGAADRAVQIQLELLSEARRRDDRWSELETLTSLANHFLNLSQTPTAGEYLRQIDAIPETEMDLRLRNFLTNARAKYSLQRGETMVALRMLSEHATELVAYIRSSADLQSGSLRLEPGFQETFTLLIDTLYEQNLHGEAIGWLDEIKNLNKASFVNSSLIKSTVLSEEEFFNDIRLSNRIDFLREQQAQTSPENRLQINTELLQLLDEKNSINNKILLSYSTSRLDPSQVQTLLSRGEQILSYTVMGNTLYIAVITATELRVHKQSLDSEIVALAESISGGLRSNRTNLDELHALYVQLVSPYLVDKLQRLSVIPDAFFYDIPLEIMPVQHSGGPFSYGSARYLIEDVPVSYQSSVSDMVFQRKNPIRRSFELEYLGIGISDFRQSGHFLPTRGTLAQLPYATVEIESAYNIFSASGNGRKLLNEQSSRQQFMDLAGRSRILHVATHSEVYASDPLFSVIHLAASQTDVGPTGNLIYAYELFNLSLQNELIVMSSCESGAGSYRQGSGIIGLGRALNMAGAKSLVLNLWSIRDQTASIITTWFYENLSAGQTKDAALRAAKLSYINTVNSDPAVWGTLILFGDQSTIKQPFNPLWWYIITGITGILVIIIYRRYVR